MTNDSKFNDARASLKDLAKKVETIDLSGSGLIGGKPRKGARKGKSRSKSPKKPKSRSGSAKKVKSRSGSAKKKSGSKKSKATMNMSEHKLADNLIQLGVQLKNMQLEGGKRRGSRKGSRKAHKPLHM